MSIPKLLVEFAMSDFAMPGFALLDTADRDPAYSSSFINDFGRRVQATLTHATSLPHGGFGMGDRGGQSRGQGGDPHSHGAQPWSEGRTPRAIAVWQDWLQQPRLGLWLASWMPVILLMLMVVVDHQRSPSISLRADSGISASSASWQDADGERVPWSSGGTSSETSDVLTFDLLTLSEGDSYSAVTPSESADDRSSDRADVNLGPSVAYPGSPAVSGRADMNRGHGPGLQSSGLQHWATGEPWHSDRLFAGGFDSLVSRTVGAAEGTRTPTGDRTLAYYGHVDPGNSVWNLGTFSYQHGASSPEEADQKQLERLYFQAQTLRAMAADRNIPLTLEVELNGIDLANQAPKAALSEEGGYMDRLREAYAQGYRGSAAVLEARVQSYLNPDTNRWDAPGLGNTYASIKADQQRRQTAIALALSHYQGSLAEGETDLNQPLAIAPEGVRPPASSRPTYPTSELDGAIAALPADASPSAASLPDMDQYGVLSFGVY